MTRKHLTWLAGIALLVTGPGLTPAAQKPAAQKPSAGSVVVYKSPT